MSETDDDPMHNDAIVGEDGRVLLFRCERFVRDICQGDACFVCGAWPNDTVFNDEHIVPNWILRRYGLFNREITLPTGERRRYSGYKVPCCKGCNTLLGRTVETPVSKLLDGDFAAVSARLVDDKARELLFVWVCLLFLKMHLKDAKVPIHVDRRLGDERIGDDYDWADLHHIHQVARSTFTKASLMPEVIGSLQIFEIATTETETETEGDYDYLDFTDAQTVMVRVGRIGIVATLNDGTAAESAWSDRLDLIAGPINDFQLREVAAMFAQANRDLIGRPLFSTFVLYGKFAMIVAQRQPLKLKPFNPATFGETLLYAVRNLVRSGAIEVDGTRDPDAVAKAISTGYVRFLTLEGGVFRQHDHGRIKSHK